MALRKQIVEVPITGGLEQKFAPQRIPSGKSAQAINLVLDKAGRLSKRPGMFPLETVDPLGSGYSINRGVSLGSWKSGDIDNLLIAGRGIRPGSGNNAVATSLQAYSDDLDGPVLRGPLPDIGLVSDQPTSASAGATFNPCQAQIGDYMVQVWCDASVNFAAATRALPQQPFTQVGTLYWSATSLATGQQVVGPTILDTTYTDVQFVRIAAVGTTFVVAYTATSSDNSPVTNGYIFCRTMTLAALTTGGGWSGITNLTTTSAAQPNPYGANAPSYIKYPGTTPGFAASAFDMRAVIGDSTSFVLAFETGTFSVVGGNNWTNGTVVVQRWLVGPPPTLSGTWNVQTYSGVNTVCGFGVRADFNLQKVAVAWSVAGNGSSTGYIVSAAIGSYPLLQALSAVTTVYTADTAYETPPYWLDVSYQDGGWITSHSPQGSCWNAAYTTSQAIGSQGNGAAASAVVSGSLFELQINSYGNNGLFNATPSIAFNSGGGAGASGTFSMSGSSGNQSVTGSIVSSGGSGYSYPNSLTATCSSSVSSGFNEPPIVTPILLYTVSGANVTDNGANYTAAPSVTFDQGGPGVGAVIGLTYGGGLLGLITGATILNPGYGYTSSPSCTIIDPSGIASGATVSLTASAGTVTGNTLTASGTGYVLPAAPGNASGIHGVFSAASGNFANFTDASTTFTAADVGSYITTSGGSDPTNVGSFIIAALVSTHVVSVINKNAVANSGANLTWTEFYNGAKVSGGATATAVLDTFGNQTVASISVTSGGQYYPTPPNISLTVANNLVGIQQDQTHRLGFPTVGGGGGTALTGCWYPENNARIIQNQFSISGTPGLQLVSFQDGFTAIGPGSFSCRGTQSGGPGACITPGVTLASCGMEANGVVYYLGWIPSVNQGGFIVLSYDRACNPGCTVLGRDLPMRPVANLQTRTALADPGWGFQPAPTGSEILFPTTWVYQSPSAPNCWTGGSFWSQSGDVYGSCSVSYVSSAQGGRLSPACGQLQSSPAQGYRMVPYGGLTAIGGALPVLYDGQNAMEQGFLYAPESILVTPVNAATGAPLSGSLTWTSPEDSYSWIFAWEHFDAQGNFHIGARSTAITITGQDILDVWGPGAIGSVSDITHETTFQLPFTGAMLFTIPSLGVSLRNNQPTDGGSMGNDLRAYCAWPTDSVKIGAYRTTLNGSKFSRIFDRFFNGDDIGDTNFTLAPPVSNSNNGSTVVTIADGLYDNILNGKDAAYPFPLLYGDGTNGTPGSLDNYCPPATPVMASDTERLYVSRGNQVLWTKQLVNGTGPGYNEVSNSITVGDDDPIIGMDIMDDKVIVLKSSGNWYLSGQGSADDGTGGTFVANFIPTDVGCVSGQSVLSTPEGIYYQSAGGVRLIDRSLTVRYVGGAVEDEINTYSTVMGCALYPQKSRMLILAGNGDAAGTSGQLTGEVIFRDYVLDAWTTGVVIDGTYSDQQLPLQVGFVSAAVAYGKGTGGKFFTVSPSPKMHLLGADGRVWREHDTLDQFAYYDNNTYVSSTWVTAPILAPSDGTSPLQARFRLWDIVAIMNSASPHGMSISVGTNYGAAANTRNWVWNNGTSVGSIAPGGQTALPLTQLRTYDGRMCESFQITLQDVSDVNSTNGQGAQFLGLTLSIGTPMDPFKLPSGNTQ